MQSLSPGVLEIAPRHHLEPDLLIVPRGVLPAEFRLDSHWKSIREWWLAVEVSGKDSEVYDRDHKGPAYLALGVREFWRVDLQDQCLYALRDRGGAEELHRERVEWLPPGRSASLVITVPELFR